jgi:nickel/cobalt transporter (NicO) family protein
MMLTSTALATLFLADQPVLAHIGHGHFLTKNLAQSSLSPTFILGGMGIAMMAGAGHALSPGHGKTMVAAYLVGSRGTSQHAVLLGLVTTLTHTISVFALGTLTLFLSKYILPEQLYPVLSLISGLMVCGVGFWLLDRFLHSAARPDHTHSHSVNHIHHHSSTEITLRSLGFPVHPLWCYC